MRPQAQNIPEESAEPVAEELRFPDFICIGAQKAGTTWIDHNLRRHPYLWLPPIKELQYFNELYIPQTQKWTVTFRREKGAIYLRRYIQKTPPDEWNFRYIARLADIAGSAVSDEWYGRLFALAASNQICGEITPDYAALPEAGIRHVVRLSPNVKIILSMRDPIERSWSHIRMMAKKRRTSEVGALESMASHADMTRRSDYAAIIAAWTKFVPQERFFATFMEDIANDPNKVLKDLCGFLGVAYRPKFFKKMANPIHSGDELEMPPSVAAILKERLRPAYDGIARLYPEIGAAWLSRHY